jgi:uncharacterized membrane protein YqaE (UPF0057 family)
MKPEEERKRPEIIYIDAIEDDEDVREKTKGPENLLNGSALFALKDAHFPFALRILAIIVGAVAALIAAIGFVGSAVWFAISLVMFRQMESANAQALKAWRAACKWTVITLGCVLAVFNPPLGVGLILLFFMYRGEEMSGAILSRFSSYSPHQN